jgi:glycerol-3-phosphate dehydrogenase
LAILAGLLVVCVAVPATHTIDPPVPFTRPAQWAALASGSPFELLVIGGGATGLGVALDAAARGWRVALVEAEDFAKGTSSRSTKLVHGGVRYLAQGNVALVREALHERSILLRNAPHLAQPLAFVVPGYRLWETPFYGTGLKMYDALAGARGLGPTKLLGGAAVMQALPGAKRRGLLGGVEYWDAQFDDARLALALARTACARGAVVVNRARVEALCSDASGRIEGARVRCAESATVIEVRARCIVNATGVWVDGLLAMEGQSPSVAREKGGARSAAPGPMVAPSQGVHLVVDARFMPGERALMVPKTADGRVLFAVPWLGKVVLGTTDTPREDMPLEPRPLQQEVAFVLAEAARYLEHAPTRADVRSVWAGLRPLVKPSGQAHTKQISREHTVLVGAGGMVTVTGGKWTTYRAMAEDVLETCVRAGRLDARPAGVTKSLRLIGAPDDASGAAVDAMRARIPLSIARTPGLHGYGSEAQTVLALSGAQRWLWREGEGGLSEAMVRFAVRHEMARTVEDVLARRSRLLFLDAARALEVADAVAVIVDEELGSAAGSASLDAFKALARQYADAGSPRA